MKTTRRIVDRIELADGVRVTIEFSLRDEVSDVYCPVSVAVEVPPNSAAYELHIGRWWEVPELVERVAEVVKDRRLVHDDRLVCVDHGYQRLVEDINGHPDCAACAEGRAAGDTVDRLSGPTLPKVGA